MKKICFLLLPVAVLLASVISCSSAPQNSESASANAALDNIFARKSVRTYLNKGVEKEKIECLFRFLVDNYTLNLLRPRWHASRREQS